MTIDVSGMELWGHIGAALVVYAPVAAYLSAVTSRWVAFVGLVVVVLVSTLPDVDTVSWLPVEHRGSTHTVWFLIGMSVIGAGIGGVAGVVFRAPGLVALVVGSAVALSVFSHLLADSVTPMGIRPLYPASRWHYSFNITRSANRRVNWLLFAVGIVISMLCLDVVGL